MKKICIVILSIIILYSPEVLAFKLWTKAEQGSLLIGKMRNYHQLYYEGERIKLANDGRFVIGLGRDAPKEIILTEVKPYGFKVNHKIKVEEREWDIQRINGLEEEMVTPPPEVMERISEEVSKVKDIRSKSTLSYFPSCFVVPILGGKVSGVFGSQRILNGQKKHYHGGIDYAAPKGRDVRSTAKGRVVLVAEDMYYSGKTVIIDHGFGVFSSYLHLSKTSVKEGEEVRQGENIGKVGSTGRSTGNHLHFGINWFDTRVDPQTVISHRICK